MNPHVLVLKNHISEQPGITRRELRELTHYDARTIAHGLGTLDALGLIRSRLERGSEVGRPSQHYYPCCFEYFYIGAIYLDLTCLLCLVKRSDGVEVAYVKEDFALGQTTVNHSVQRCYRLLRSLERCHGIRLSSVGLTIRNQQSPRFLPLAVRLLERRLEIPVFGSYPIEAFAWMFRRHHPEVRRLVTVHCRYEIELSVLDGDVLDLSAPSFSRDLVHTTGDSHGPLCWCGKRGCLENYINEYLMVEEFRSRGREHGQIEELRHAYGEGDGDALEIVGKGESCLEKAFRAIAKRYRPDGFYHVLFDDDRLIHLMSGLTGGSWKGRSCGRTMEYAVYACHGDAGYACLSATAESALYRWHQVVGLQPKELEL